MNSEQRKALREALIGQGWTRHRASHDSGDGSYGELWADPTRQNSLVISWGPRSE